MRLGSREFSPRYWAVILYLAVLSCMLLLGNWQLQRAALKVEMRNAAQAAANAPGKPIAAFSDIKTAASQYSRVQLQGTYDESRQFLWDNRTHDGVAGYEVIIPMLIENGLWVLVNRGWVGAGASRDILPDVTLPESMNDVPVSLEGYLSQPSKGFASGAALSSDDDWPKRAQYLDYEAFAQALGESVVPVLVQGQSLGIDAKTPTVLTPRPEWLTANWQPAASGPAKHYSYAFQWFAMAVALTGIFLVVNSSKRSPD